MSELDLTEAIESGRDIAWGAACLCGFEVRNGASCVGCSAEAAVRAAAPIIERAARREAEGKIKYLTDEVVFWKDQQKLAANVAATIADLDEVAPALRQLLAAERKRCRQAEDEVDRLLALVPIDAQGSRTEPA